MMKISYIFILFKIMDELDIKIIIIYWFSNSIVHKCKYKNKYFWNGFKISLRIFTIEYNNIIYYICL